MFLYFVSSLGQGYYSDTKLTNTVADKMSGGGRKQWLTRCQVEEGKVKMALRFLANRVDGGVIPWRSQQDGRGK
jgi:hypothetical protein